MSFGHVQFKRHGLWLHKLCRGHVQRSTREFLHPLQGLLIVGIRGIPMHLDLQQGLCAATAAAISGTAAAALPRAAAAAALPRAAAAAALPRAAAAALPRAAAAALPRAAAAAAVHLHAHERRPSVGRRQRRLPGGGPAAGDRAVRSTERAADHRCEWQSCVDWRHRRRVRGHVGVEPVQHAALVHQLVPPRAQRRWRPRGLLGGLWPPWRHVERQ
jgi:hypothetical protein